MLRVKPFEARISSEPQMWIFKWIKWGQCYFWPEVIQILQLYFWGVLASSICKYRHSKKKCSGFYSLAFVFTFPTLEIYQKHLEDFLSTWWNCHIKKMTMKRLFLKKKFNSWLAMVWVKLKTDALQRAVRQNVTYCTSGQLIGLFKMRYT